MLNNTEIEKGYDKNTASVNLNVRTPFVGKAVSSKWSKFGGETFAVKNTLAKRLLADQTDADYARLVLQMQPVSFRGGEAVTEASGSGEFVYLPETAVFSQLNMLEDGRTIETAMIGSEGIVGLASILGLQPSAKWTQALITGTAWRMPAKFLKREFERAGAFQTALFDYINSYITQISQRAACNNHHHIEEKFCSWLLMLGDRCGRNKLSLTQEQIAQFLGVHRPSVTCIAQDLRNKKMIDYVRGQIFILDRARLEGAACECYSAIS